MPCSPGSHREGQKMPLPLAEPGWCFREQQRCHPAQGRPLHPCRNTSYDPTHDFDLTMWHHIAAMGTRPTWDSATWPQSASPQSHQACGERWGSHKGMDEPRCFNPLRMFPCTPPIPSCNAFPKPCRRMPRALALADGKASPCPHPHACATPLSHAEPGGTLPVF